MPLEQLAQPDPGAEMLYLLLVLKVEEEGMAPPFPVDGDNYTLLFSAEAFDEGINN